MRVKKKKIGSVVLVSFTSTSLSRFDLVLNADVTLFVEVTLLEKHRPISWEVFPLEGDHFLLLYAIAPKPGLKLLFPSSLLNFPGAC